MSVEHAYLGKNMRALVFFLLSLGTLSKDDDDRSETSVKMN